MHVPFPADAGQLKSALLEMVEANRARNATLRVVVVRNRGGLFEGPDQNRDFDVIAFTSDINPWGESVRLGLKPNGRYAQNEFAGAKILSWAQNLTWYEEAHQRGFDEVVLLNERGEVSECTSANIFAATGREVVTPPLALRLPAGSFARTAAGRDPRARYFNRREESAAGRSGTRRSGVHHLHHSRSHAGFLHRRIKRSKPGAGGGGAA
jgi:hypothetical protein